MKQELRIKAATLRRRGFLFSEIAEELGIAKSTAFAWTHNLSLSADETANVAKNLQENQRKKISGLAQINKQRREKRDLILQYKANELVQSTKLALNHKKIICAVMFWCEGGKDVR